MHICLLLVVFDIAFCIASEYLQCIYFLTIINNIINTAPLPRLLIPHKHLINNFYNDAFFSSTAVTQNNNFSKALSTFDKVADVRDSTRKKIP